MSQEELARALRRSTSWLAKAEQKPGERPLDDQSLAELADQLGLVDLDRFTLWQVLAGRTPPAEYLQQHADQSGPLAALLADSSAPAYIADPNWNITQYNPTMGLWFPHVRDVDQGTPSNFMRFGFLDERARQQLVDLESVWLPPMAAELRAAYAARPDDGALADLVNEILDASPLARQLWDEQLSATGYPHGAIRTVRPAHLGGQTVTYEVQAFTPLGSGPQPRAIILRPTHPVPEPVGTGNAVADWR